ncbi:uncharacterized protein LOC112341121 [Selaginella moellendorffii]|uniref:uncharacterized protein LOC112341121 n=1 Tax=Selaginella moellendorffii TaxID=88036 RepID=UPI000D1CDBFB|nr:uncharacterized protein LOC112341121 [Selaginella moellendorffii]|eukprot:XP_024516440.1 uncharacterized protein LOC112341121 [Selaginella moellendorffii]
MAMAMAVPAALVLMALVMAAAADKADSGLFCKECLDVATDAQDFLASPHNLETVVDFVQAHGCAKVPLAYKDKCDEMSQEYVSVLFSTLQDYMTPQKMCLDTGICAGGKHLEMSATSCSACHFLATKALAAGNRLSPEAIREELTAACSSHKWIQDRCMSVLDRFGPGLLGSPAHFCMESEVCKANGVKGVGRNNCALCRYLALEMKTKLQDPETQEKLIEFLLANCQKLHNHEDECKLLVLEYGPQVLANLEAVLDDDEICAKIGMCPSTLSLSSAI